MFSHRLHAESVESTRSHPRFGAQSRPKHKLRSLSHGPPSRLTATLNTEEYGVISESGFLQVSANPLSTFSIDVDTASYSNVRRFLEQD